MYKKNNNATRLSGKELLVISLMVLVGLIAISMLALPVFFRSYVIPECEELANELMDDVVHRVKSAAAQVGEVALLCTIGWYILKYTLSVITAQ